MTRKRTVRAAIMPFARFALPALLGAVSVAAQQYVISTVVGGAAAPTPATAQIASIGAPQNIVSDSAGNIYFTALNGVYKEFTNGTLILIAGNSRAGYSGDGGLAINAQLRAPVGLALDAAGNVYIADSRNNRVRKVTVNGIIVTVAGNGTAGFSGDGGPAVSAGLSGVTGVAVDANGNLFIADTGNNRVRKVAANGVITTLAGNGSASASGDGGQALSAQLSATSIAVDTRANLYIGDTLNYRVRKVSPDGTISTVAGAGTPGYSGDGSPAQGAQLSVFRQLAVDSNSNVYIADTGNSCIRRVSSGAETITTVAGNGKNGYFGDGVSATLAALAFPAGVTLDGSGNILIADTGNYRLRAVLQDGTMQTIGGNGSPSYSGDGGAALNAQISGPQGLALDKFGNLLFADTANNVIRKVLPNGIIGTVAGNGVAGFSGDGGAAPNARLSAPQGLAVTASGDVFIADSGNYRIREVPDGTISTVAGDGDSFFTADGGQAVNAGTSVSAVVIDSSRNLFFGDPGNFRVREVNANGNISTVAGNGSNGFSGDNGPAIGAQLSTVAGVALDSAGDIFIVDAGNQRIRKVDTAGVITTVAGNGKAGFSGDGGPAVNAQLNNPSSVAVDAAGNLYIADTDNNRVREVSASGAISTIAGNGSAVYTGDGGVGFLAGLLGPKGVAIGKSGAIYIADTGNNAIRLLTPISQSLQISAVVDAASESTVPLSPGKIVVIYGTGLGPSQLVVNQPVNGVFSQQLAGTTVAFRGVSAPIYYTSATQVAAIVPYEVTGSTTVPVAVSYQGQLATPFNAAFTAASPGIFTANATGAGQAAAINVVDGTLNSATNPVRIGSYISLYLTGEGQTTPGGSDGKLASGPVYPQPTQKVSVTVGGVAATFNYAGAVPGTVAGLMQINVLIPPAVTPNATATDPPGITPGGYVPIAVTVGNASTVNGAVWIAVSN